MSGIIVFLTQFGSFLPKFLSNVKIKSRHTKVKAALQLLSNSHQLHSSPEVWSIGFWHTECPTSTIYISSVLPHGLKALFEEVDGFSHLDILNRGIVIIPPEILHRFDLRAELLKSGRV
jgi:hypothetical protein